MDFKVYKIILSSRDPNDKLIMKLDVELLSNILKPLGDIPVAIISIFGRSKSGKSYLMNYILRYLNNNLAANSIELNETLEGFDWGSNNQEFEQGIHISKPFIIKRDNEPEFAVILMDNQGYFNEDQTKEDSSSLIGLNLIMTSCAIYDCNSIDEGIITALLPILEYGTFIKKQEIAQNRKEFSKLIFLVRDWDNACDHNYGLDGGKSFLEKSLHIKKDISIPSQKARVLIRRSFEEILCFLLPHPGEKFKSGSANIPDKLFISNLDDFIMNLLKVKKLSPMRIQNINMTSSVLCNYLENCVKLFNNDHIVSPEKVFILKNKFSNILRIYGLKEIYSTIVREKLKTTFVARKNLSSIHDDVKLKIVKIYNDIKFNFDKADIDELNIIFEKVLESCSYHLHEENENKRNSIAVETIDNCIKKYHDMVSEIKISAFEDMFSVDEILDDIKTEVNTTFNRIYENEEKELFSIYQVKLYETIEKAEKDFKLNNRKNLSELKLKIEHLLQQFKKIMIEEIDKSLFLTDEKFNLLERKHILNIWKLFDEDCKIGIFNVKSDFQIKLNEAKKEIYNYYMKKCDKAKSTIVKDMNNCINNYKFKMNENLATFKSEEELILLHSSLKYKISAQISEFSNKNPNVDISLNLKELEDKLNLELGRFKLELFSLLEKQRYLFSETIKEAKELYKQGMSSLFEDNNSYTDESLNLFHIRYKDESLKYLKTKTNNLNNTDLQNISLLQLEAKLKEVYDKQIEKNNFLKVKKEKEIYSKIDELILRYEEEMAEISTSVVTEEEIIKSHEKLKMKITTEFNNTIISLGITKPELYVNKLEKELENSKNDIIEAFGFKFSRFIKNCRKFYKDEMSKIFKNEPFLSSGNLKTLHDKVISKALTKYENERENIPREKFQDIIIKYLSDLFNIFNEENNMNTPSSPAIGIDLGTTNSCVAYYKPGKLISNVEVIPNELGKNTTPSCVLILDNIDEVGINAKQNAYKNQRSTIYSIKRLIGRKFSDESVQQDIKYWPFVVIPDENDEPIVRVVLNNLKEKKYYPEQISAKVLLKMKQITETRLGKKVSNAVITVPAYFNEAQKEATKHAGKIAGLNVLKIITEPTASAIAFKKNRDNNIQILSRDEPRRVLIFDLGGGTFDVAILKIDGGNINIEAYGGNTHLGGDDFDNNVINYCIEKFRNFTGLTISKNGVAGSKAMSRLRNICEEQKCNLSLSEKVNISADSIFEGKDLNIDITREKFEELNQHLFLETINIVDKTLKDANINLDDINDVLLVGGSTRIPKIQKLLENYFKGKTLCRNVNPDEAVAVGAAIQAAILNGEQSQNMIKFTISEVCPLSLGVKVKGGFMSVIIPKNSRVPTKKMKLYETTSRNQNKVIVEIFEGEEIMVESNRLLGKFVLTGIPSGPAGHEEIEVTFEMTDEAILHVEAKIHSTGSVKSIDIIEHKGRISDEVLQLLIEQESLINSF